MKPSEPDEDESPASVPPHPPTLDYHSPGSGIRRSRPPRKTIPKAFGVGFIATAIPLTVLWLNVELWNLYLPHVALYLSGAGTFIGIVMLSFSRVRLAAAGALVAVGLWFLLLGSCYGLGGVRTIVF